uniref:hypothetical protein n=1 Tax=Gemmiger formicilis TaxID=745368 RepID=UPI004027463C
RVLRGHRGKDLHQEKRIFLVVQPPDEPGQPVRVGNAPGRAGRGAGGVPDLLFIIFYLLFIYQ